MSSIVAAYDKTLFYNEAGKYCVLRLKTADPMVPENARDKYKFADHLIRFVAVGYDLPRTDKIKLDLDGKWVDGKYGPQFQVNSWHELVPPTIEGVLGYLSSGLLKGIGPKTAGEIVQRFGTDSLNVIETQPERLLEIKGITVDKLDEIKTGYAESKAVRDIMMVLAPFKLTPCCARASTSSARSPALASKRWTPLYASPAATSTIPCGYGGRCSTPWRSPAPRAATSTWRRTNCWVRRWCC